MKFPKLPFPFSGIPGPFKAEQDQLKQDAPEQDAGRKSPSGFPGDKTLPAKSTADLAAPRKVPSTLSRQRARSGPNLFSYDEVKAVREALQKWVLEVKADPAELKSRGDAATIFIRVLGDPSMNMPKLLTDHFDALSEDIQAAIGKVEVHHIRTKAKPGI